MTEKYFIRKKLTIIIYFVSISLLTINITGVILTIILKLFLLVSVTLIGISFGLMGLAIAVNRVEDVIINFENKEVIVNISFNNKENYSIPFDSIVNVYEINDEKLKKDLKLKKYPKRTLVIERKDYKEYIPLKLFDEGTIILLKKELLKVRDSYENLI